MKRNYLKSIARLVLLLSLVQVLSGCDQQAPQQVTPGAPDSSTAAELIEDTQNISLPFLRAAKQSFDQALDGVTALRDAVSSFTQQPAAEKLADADAALKLAHDHFLATRLFRQIGLVHPQLDLSQSTPEVIHPVQIRLDQQPIIPGYLDSVAGYPINGLIYSDLPITAETLNTEHQFSDTGYVAMGFHALEFMLTGDPALEKEQYLRFESPTAEQQTDTPESSARKRRSQYADLLAGMLTEDLKRLHTEWTSMEGYYPQTLLSMSQEQQEQIIIDTLRNELLALAARDSQQAAGATASSHHTKRSLEARSALMRSVLNGLAQSEFTLPDDLRAFMTQAEPGQTTP